MDENRQLIKLLHEAGLVSRDIDPVIYSSKNCSPIHHLSRQGRLNEKVAIAAVAKRLGLDFYDLFDPKWEARFSVASFAAQVSNELCWAHRLIPLFEERGAIIVAAANPLDMDALKELQFSLSRPIRVVISEEAKILHLLAKYFPRPLVNFSDLEEPATKCDLEVIRSIGGEEAIDEDSPLAPVIIRLVNRIIADAIEFRASDIHIDPTPAGVDVRYRIDGVMQHILDAPKRAKLPLVSRIKLLSGMNISEKRKPQDGRFSVKFNSLKIDIRASAIPTAHGEKIVLRLLRTNFDELSFDKLGLPADIQAHILEALSSTARMLLVTGPTGSGKTTTLYTCLKLLHDGTRNIETVEDPIEYQVPGTNQIQVNEAANVTFANALRSILRQDPDVIMVGEIRDKETADIALQASQTGHLVISTLHTNDAPSAITRLLNLGSDPFIMASSLAGVLAQRLVRKICVNCRGPITDEMLKKHAHWIKQYGLDHVSLIAGRGCEACRYTGYHGRIGVYSYLTVTEKIRDIICRRGTVHEFLDEAEHHGFRNLDQAAVDLVRQGITTLQEISPYLSHTESQESPTMKASVTVESGMDDEAHPRILVVEDDPTNRSSLSFILRKAAFQVVAAEDGVAGLDLLATTPCDLIVTGLGLPIMDGKQFLRRLREVPQCATVPVIVLTSADSEENEAELLTLGANEFISRNKSPAVILARINKLLPTRGSTN